MNGLKHKLSRWGIGYWDVVLSTFVGLTFVLNLLIPYQSLFVERIFSRGLFSLIRNLWDYSLSFLPFGCIYWLLLVIGWYLFWYRKRTKFSWKRLGMRFIRLSFLLYVLFYWMWGFNYKRPSLDRQLSLSNIKVTPSFIYQEYCRVLDSMLVIRAEIGDIKEEISELSPNDLRTDLEAAYKSMELPYSGRVRAIKLRPKGSLLHFSTAGIYLPFVGQGHIDAGLHPIVHPFTMMHEMSHGYGWTGEDACNFLSFIAGINSDHPAVRYSVYFGYWRYLRSTIYRIDQPHFEAFYRDVPSPIKEDYSEVLAYSDSYADLMPKLRDLMYDQYLKSHGISSGLINYSQMIQLSFKYQEATGSLNL